MRRHALTDREDFEHWLMSIDGFLADLFASLPDETRRKLDFSPESLNVVEAWILAQYPSSDAMVRSDASRTVNALACYVGETIRKGLGGKWDIDLSDPDSAFFAVPIIVDPAGALAPACPLTLTTACANRRTGVYLKRVLDNYLRRKDSR